MSAQSEMSKDFVNMRQSTETELDNAISVATEELGKIEIQRRRLQLAIRTFRHNKKEGITWPQTD